MIPLNTVFWEIRDFKIATPDGTIIRHMGSPDIVPPPTEEEPRVIKLPISIGNTIVLRGEAADTLWWLFLSKEQLSYKLTPGWNRRIWGKR